MAKMIRGMTVPDATELLRNTSKKSARLFEAVLHSAVANAQHNFKQDAQTMVLKSVIVNQGTAYRRGIPMARGRVRPIRKFLCHIEVTLGFPGDNKESGKAAAAFRTAKNEAARKTVPAAKKTALTQVKKPQSKTSSSSTK